MAVNLDDCRINHRELHVWIVRYGIEYPSENAGLHPIPIALEDRIPVAEHRRQIPPGAARSGNPQHRFEKQTIVTSAATRVRRLTQTMRLHPRPLGVRQNESIHAKLLSKLESRPSRFVNPDSQQALVHGRTLVLLFKMRGVGR